MADKVIREIVLETEALIQAWYDKTNIDIPLDAEVISAYKCMGYEKIVEHLEKGGK